MKPDEIKYLLGGYATGTLTPEEQKALFEAALQDQELFEAMAREQALKEALEDRAARAGLLRALETPQRSWRDWFRWRYPVAAAGVLAAAALSVLVLVRINERPGAAPAEQTTQVAELRKPELPPPAREAAAEPAATPKRTAPRVVRKQAAVEDRVAAVVSPPAPAAAPPTAQPVRAEEQAANKAVREATAEAAAPQPAASQVADAQSEFRAPERARMEGRGVAGGVVGGVVGGVPAGAMMVRMPPPEASYTVKPVEGDRYQLVVRAAGAGVLYVFRRNGQGAWEAVTPGGMSVQAGTETTTPIFVLNKNAPAPQVLLVVSRTTLTDLAPAGAALNAAVERLRNAPPSTGTAVVPVRMP